MTTMNKLIAKTVKKVNLLSVILTVLLAAAILVTAIFGIHYSATLDDCNTLTVTVNTKTYEDKFDDIKEICEKEFKAKDLRYNLLKGGVMSGDDCEIMYEFDKDADLSAAKKALEDTFAAKTAANGDWNGSFINVSTGNEKLQTKLPASYVVRAAVAVAVFAVLAFVYVALRYKLIMGVVAAVCSVLGPLLAAAVILLVRIPVTNSFLYAVALAAPVTAVIVMLTLNKLRAAEKSETDEEVSVAEKVAENVAIKETLAIAIVGGAALVVLGAIATASVRWFALSALLALAAAVFAGLLFAPALYLPLKERADKKALENPKSGYVGAKKKEDRD